MSERTREGTCRGGDVFMTPPWGLGSGGFTNLWPVKPFETVMVIKGCTN